MQVLFEDCTEITGNFSKFQIRKTQECNKIIDSLKGKLNV